MLWVTKLSASTSVLLPPWKSRWLCADAVRVAEVGTLIMFSSGVATSKRATEHDVQWQWHCRLSET